MKEDHQFVSFWHNLKPEQRLDLMKEASGLPNPTAVIHFQYPPEVVVNYLKASPKILFRFKGIKILEYSFEDCPYKKLWAYMYLLNCSKESLDDMLNTPIEYWYDDFFWAFCFLDETFGRSFARF